MFAVTREEKEHPGFHLCVIQNWIVNGLKYIFVSCVASMSHKGGGELWAVLARKYRQEFKCKLWRTAAFGGGSGQEEA